jgi:hypothetical protein
MNNYQNKEAHIKEEIKRKLEERLQFKSRMEKSKASFKKVDGVIDTEWITSLDDEDKFDDEMIKYVEKKLNKQKEELF